MKALMAITGLIMVGFLLMHMYGNTKILVSRDAFNEYSHHLREFLVPIFPTGGFLWVFRIFMLVVIALHIWSAVALWRRANANISGVGYRKAQAKGGTYVRFLMRWGGVMILLFLIFHILTFTMESIKVGYGPAGTDPASRFVFGFSEWWLLLLYAVAMAFVCLHVWHGFWSAFATLGANTSKGSQRTLAVISAIIAVLLYVGFMFAPVLVTIGVVK